MATDPQILEQQVRELKEQLDRESAGRQKAENDLECSREMLRNVLREIPAIVFAADADGSIVFFNREFERVSGYDAEDLLNDEAALDLLIPDSGKATDAARCTRKGETKAGTEKWRFKGKDGLTKTVKWSRISSQMPLLGWQSWKIGIDISEQERNREKIKKLSGLLPICASCKKIRDDKGYWNQLEAYIRDHSDAEFSHGICPDCVHKLYPKAR